MYNHVSYDHSDCSAFCTRVCIRREEEQEALAGIFDDDFAKVGKARCEIILRCTLGEAAAGHAADPPAGGSGGAAATADIVAEEQVR